MNKNTIHFTNCTRINSDGNFIISPDGMRLIMGMLSRYAATLNEYANDHGESAAELMRGEARTADELADAIRGNKFPRTVFKMQVRWYQRPDTGTAMTKRFDGCDEITVKPHGTGLHIVGRMDGERVSQLYCDHPSMMLDAIRMAFHEDWKSTNESIGNDVDRHYARGGQNWAGD